MISATEIQRLSASLGVSPDVVDHDYALGCFLSYLATMDDVSKSWVFKGGTSLAKCYFRLYRFSEDLDFTLKAPIISDALRAVLDQAKRTTQSEIGIRMDLRETAVEPLLDDYGRESFEAKVYHAGVWRTTGSPRAIRVHVNSDELLAFPVQSKTIQHSYSDASQLPKVDINVYSLEEILVEKLRALSGQRRYAIARDLFDNRYLSLAGLDLKRAIAPFREKCRSKGLKPTIADLKRFISQREEYEINWTKNLEYLIPHEIQCSFDEAWDISLRLLEQALKQ
jgi:predicted nucleotidyltransferase component of viral defense system